MVDFFFLNTATRLPFFIFSRDHRYVIIASDARGRCAGRVKLLEVITNLSRGPHTPIKT
jgi:hypothetical protein